MKADPTKKVFLQTVAVALGNLKQQLQQDYECAYPQLGEVIHLVLDEEESKAWELAPFPHLVLPDLVEAHVAQLNLRPIKTKNTGVFTRHQRSGFENYQPAFA